MIAPCSTSQSFYLKNENTAFHNALKVIIISKKIIPNLTVDNIWKFKILIILL
jgi:hypothetical protein